MKKHPLTLVLTTTLLLTTLFLTAQNVSFKPEKPTPGSEIMVKYAPEGTPLEGIKTIEAIAYLLEDELPVAKEIELTWKDNAYVGKIMASANTKAFFVSFADAKSDKKDNNNGKGYYSKMYTAAGEAVQGARANISSAYGAYAGIMNVEQDYVKSMEYLQKEFKAYADSKNKKAYLNNYASLAQRNKDEQAKTEIKEHITRLTTKKKASEEDLIMAHSLSKIINDKEQAEALSAIIKKKYPKGEFVKTESINAFFQERDLAKREEIFKDLQKKMTDEKGKTTLANLASMLASGYGNKDWAKFDYYNAMVENKSSKASLYNNIAWNLAGAGLEGEAKDLEKAKELSKQALEFTKEIIANPAKYKSSYMTEKQYAQNMESTYGMYADTYGLINYRLGDYEKALKYQKIACEGKYASGDMNERYALYMEKAEGAKAVMPFLEDKIRNNKATAKMKEQYKTLFLANSTKEEVFEKYMASLEKEAKTLYKEELKEKMLDREAPNFSLVNLDGEKVDLKDLKGKVVILDFWAVWCGPCKASFPGMQMAVDKFKDRDDVVFLFINTWENNVDDKHKNASDYIEKNNFTFNVLLDNDSKVVADYKVRGIPTKFVLDGNGRVRFESIGFDGNADKLVDELSIMIELAKASNAGVTTAARP